LSLADVVCYAGCLLSQMRRDALALREGAEEVMELALEKVAPPWTGTGAGFRGAALVWLGEAEEGIAQLREAVYLNRSRGTTCYCTIFLGSLAEAQATAGRPEDGLRTLDDALIQVEQTGERCYEAELIRLRGELLLMRGRDADAEASFRQAIEVAQRQEARSWELRAAVSLARLWRTHGRTAEARTVLAPIYGWFSEGFDTLDLKAAVALLAELDDRNGSS
jgi:predicted ATPase